MSYVYILFLRSCLPAQQSVPAYVPTSKFKVESIAIYKLLKMDDVMNIEYGGIPCITLHQITSHYIT